MSFGQLRKQAGEAATLRPQAAEASQLRARLATATQNLARTESELADAAKLSPEELQQLKGEAQSVQCVNNLKQICLAARIGANDHQNVFPPDFISMKDELATPKILFCPADATAIRVTEWSQLNPSSISAPTLHPNWDIALPPAGPLDALRSRAYCVASKCQHESGNHHRILHGLKLRTEGRQFGGENPYA